MLMAPQPSSSLDVATGRCQLKQLMRIDVDGARVTITVEEGPAGELVNSSTHHLLCLRQVLQVRNKCGLAEKACKCACMLGSIKSVTSVRMLCGWQYCNLAHPMCMLRLCVALISLDPFLCHAGACQDM